MISQSEHNIKKSALRFLKMYYKHRPRLGETKSKVDQITQDGIIADGMISFEKEEGNHFVAAVEATSFETRDEVKYKMQYPLLNWDSFMWACIVSAIAVLLGHYFHWFTFGKGDFQLIISLVTLFSIVFLGYRYFFNRGKKYRYIYALQQFRQYHADEQWVAIGDNVFYGPEDPSLEELRKQCVSNGFGLLSIDKELNTHLIISPSREQLFGSRRKMLDFTGANSAEASAYNPLSWWGNLKNKLGLASTDNSVTRYQKRYYQPIIASVLMLGLIGFVAYEDLRQKDFLVIDDEVAYDAQLSNILNKDVDKDPNHDAFDQKIDTSYVAPLKRKIPDSYMAIVDGDKRNEFIRKKAPLRKKDKLTAKGASTEIYVESGNGDKVTSYDCSRFFNFFGKKYVVQDSQYPTLEEAERRMNLLKRSGFKKANLLWLGCFYEDSKDYIIYIEWLYETKKDAITNGIKYRRKLKSQSLKEEDLFVRTIEKK